jgi:hypothetical protein
LRRRKFDEVLHPVFCGITLEIQLSDKWGKQGASIAFAVGRGVGIKRCRSQRGTKRPVTLRKLAGAVVLAGGWGCCVPSRRFLWRWDYDGPPRFHGHFTVAGIIVAGIAV